MKQIGLMLLAATGVAAQTTASVQGKLVDAKTGKAVSAAWVVANRTAVPPLSKRVRSGGDGSFQIQGLTPGTYSVCVQVAGEQYLDPCQWGAAPTNVTVSAAQSATAVVLHLTAASVLTIQITDPLKALKQLTTDGRHPDLTLGVWGPHGVFYPAHPSGNGSVAASIGGVPTYSYRVAVPFDTSLKLLIASHDLKLGDANGVALPNNAGLQAFQQATGDASAKRFAFSILKLGPG